MTEKTELEFGGATITGGSKILLISAAFRGYWWVYVGRL